MEPENYFEHYNIPAEIRKHIIDFCLASTVDTLRLVSRSWLRVVNKTNFIITCDRDKIDILGIQKLARYSTQLSIEFAQRQNYPLATSIAQLGTQLQGLKLHMYISYESTFPPSNFTALTNLTDVDISLDRDGDLSFLSQLHNLKRLRLISDLEEPVRFTLISTIIEDLSFSCPRDAEDILNSVSNVSRLTKLRVDYRCDAKEIQKFSNLKELFVFEAYNVRSMSLPNLESLVMDSSPIYEEVLNGHTKLTKLALRSIVQDLDEDQLQWTVLGQLTNLRVLKLDYAEDRYNGPAEFFSRLTNLEELNVFDFFEEENSAHLQYLNSNNLTKLNVQIYNDYAVSCVRHLTKLSSSLLDLDVSNSGSPYVELTPINSLTKLTKLSIEKFSSFALANCHFSSTLKALSVFGYERVNVNLNLPNLEVLKIFNVQFTEEDAINLSSTLQRFEFGQTRFNTVTGSFAHLTRVTSLKAETLIESDVDNILQMVNLRRLRIEAPLTEDQILRLSALTALQSLYYENMDEYEA